LNSLIIIYYPSTVTSTDISSNNVSSAYLNGINVNSAVVYQVQSNTITISNMFKSNFNGGVVTIGLPLFLNPPTIQPSMYMLSVLTSDNYIIYTSSYTLTTVLKNLVSNSISSSSYKVLDMTTLTLSIELNYPATSISVILPANDLFLFSGF
jgi:hypothetical protein